MEMSKVALRVWSHGGGEETIALVLERYMGCTLLLHVLVGLDFGIFDLILNSKGLIIKYWLP